MSSCSTPNTAVLTYYGRVWSGSASTTQNCVWGVSWRDDRGKAHEADYQSHPDNFPLCSPLFCVVCLAAAQDRAPKALPGADIKAGRR